MINKKKNNKKYDTNAELTTVTHQWNVDKRRKKNNYEINVISFTKGQN